MLIWLDNASNVKGAPNENFAREVMELFTMGIGNYTQQDVTEAARAFTGWTIDADDHIVHLRPGRPRRRPEDLPRATRATSAARTSSPSSPRAPRRPRSSPRKLARFFLGARSLGRLSRRASRTCTPPARATSARSSGRSSSPTTSTRPRTTRHDQVAHRDRRRRVPVAGRRIGRGRLHQLSAAMGQNPSSRPTSGAGRADGPGSTPRPTSSGSSSPSRSSSSLSGRATRAVTNSAGTSAASSRDRSFASADALIDFLADRLGLVPPSDPTAAGAARLPRRRRRPVRLGARRPSTTISRARGGLSPDVEPGVPAPVGEAMAIDRRTLSRAPA